MGDYPMIENMQFVPGWTDFQLNNSLKLDILIDMKGLESYTFDECLEMASIAQIENVQVSFLHINQLIENKRVINRPKDQIDIIALEQIRKLRDEQSWSHKSEIEILNSEVNILSYITSTACFSICFI